MMEGTATGPEPSIPEDIQVSQWSQIIGVCGESRDRHFLGMDES